MQKPIGGAKQNNKQERPKKGKQEKQTSSEKKATGEG